VHIRTEKPRLQTPGYPVRINPENSFMIAQSGKVPCPRRCTRHLLQQARWSKLIRGTEHRHGADQHVRTPRIAAAAGSRKWHDDLNGLAKRRILRVLVAPDKLEFYFDGSEIHGALYEFCREFERFLNRKLETGNLAIHLLFVPLGRDMLLPRLSEGYGDLVATLIVTADRTQFSVDFTDPVYDDARAVIVSGPGIQLSRLEDLSGHEVYYFRNTILFEKLSRLSEDLQRAGKPPIRLGAAPADLQRDDLLEMVNAGLVPMTVAEDKVAQYWAKVLPNLNVHSDIVLSESPLAWAVQQNTPQLKSIVNEFLRDHKVGTLFGNTVTEKYRNYPGVSGKRLSGGYQHATRPFPDGQVVSQACHREWL